MPLDSRTQIRRAALMGSTALFAMALTNPAMAQDGLGARLDFGDVETMRISDGIDSPARGPSYGDTVVSAHQLARDGVAASTRENSPRARQSMDGAPQAGIEAYSTTIRIQPGEVEETPSVTINNNFTPAQTFDPTNVNGIGQLVTDAGGGSIGLCTATLVNRRTVLFAAHCVNTRAATAYGAQSGGVGIGIGFETNTRANASGQPDELVNWLLGAGAGPGRFKSNTAQAFYNISQVFYDPRSMAPASCTAPTSCFIEADIATAVLDAPARNVPTWTMLFSPLASPATINTATGTGYHVTITGYGRNGTGTTGAVGNDYRRRVAENILGGLTSINARNLFLFGTAGTPSRPQLLYFLDFDDPQRGQIGANARDFNGFRDNALPREGSTGPGDSGGPLIIDQAFGTNVRTVIGTLSGGSTFFTGQPGGSYGTQSFYQPLFLYWDWIVANNPYRYATALAGNRSWEDPTTWLTELDPAYRVLLNGQLVNGIPTNLGGTNQVTTPQFGEFCFQSPNSSSNPVSNECENAATGQPRNNVPNTAESADPLNAQIVSKEDDVAGTAGTTAASRAGLDGAFDASQADPGFANTVNPAPTLANGLPGATNFVPNNFDGVRATGAPARYYDVTLRNAGNVTLSSNVTIDNFTIAGAQSQLTVAASGSLTSLVEVNHLTGVMNVNGTVTSVGDYFLMSGLLTGTGRINAPFLTSVIGNIAPGTLGTVGTLTIAGNLVLSSGSQLFIDTGGNGVSDLLAVVRSSPGATDGLATLGGLVTVSARTGTSFVRFGDIYTILTAQGGISGTFTGAPISAILRPDFLYTANTVQVRIAANPYAGVVNAGSRAQRAYASLLDSGRSRGALPGIYDILDLESAASIQSTLEALAPRTETLRTSLAIAAIDNGSRMIRDRLNAIQPGNLGGSIAYYGRRVQTAALTIAGLDNVNATLSDMSVQPDVHEGRLPETMSGFVSAGYLDGDSLPMAGTLSSVRDQFNGWYIAGGIEKEAFGNGAIGFALSYTNLDGTTGTGAQSAGGELYQATVYGKHSPGVVYVDGQFSLGVLNTTTERNGSLPGQAITLRSDGSTFTAAGEIGVGAMFGDTIRFGPRAAARASFFNFGRTRESGGATALDIDRREYESLQGRAGLVIDGVGRIRPNASASYVHEFSDHASGFGAGFVGGTGNVLFDLAGQDKDWFEVTGGLTIDAGNAEISVAADTTIERDDVSNQSYRASVKIRF